MRLRNTTGLSDELIRDIVRFVRPPGISRFDVEVRNSSTPSCRGRAYWGGSGYHDTADPFVVCRIGSGPYPRWGTGYGFTGRFVLASRVESLVWIMAHELRHLWQANHNRGRVWGSRGRFSEIDCDAYALRMLRAWKNRNVWSGSRIPEKFRSMLPDNCTLDK